MAPKGILIILFLTAPIYLLSKWLLDNLKLGSKKDRKFFAIIPALIVSPLVYIGIIMIWILSTCYYPKKEFNKEEWKTNIEERYKMTENIIDSRILIGKTKEEVIELLGTDNIKSGKDHILYSIGFVPGIANIDPDVLDIYFKNGRVIKVSQY